MVFAPGAQLPEKNLLTATPPIETFTYGNPNVSFSNSEQTWTHKRQDKRHADLSRHDLQWDHSISETPVAREHQWEGPNR